MQALFLTSFRWDREGGASWARALNMARALRDQGVRVFLASRRGGRDWNHDTRELEPGLILLGATQGPETPSGPADSPERRLAGAWLAWRGREVGTALLYFPSIHQYRADLDLLESLAPHAMGRLFLEKNEMEEALVRNVLLVQSPRESLQRIICYRRRLREARLHDRLVSRYAGVVAISTRIEEWCRAQGVPVLRVPILCGDQTGSSAGGDGPRRGSGEALAVGFFGVLSQRKEGIGTFLEAVARAGLGPRLQLNLFGRSSHWQRAAFACRASHCRLSHVTHHGQVSNAEATAAMARQDLLLLPRPTNMQTEYGFSTKLAEFLASGTPVLVTAVSDNALYIRDGEHGFVTQAGDTAALAAKLKQIIESRERLADIGQAGRRLALTHFHYSAHGQALKQFLFAAAGTTAP